MPLNKTDFLKIHEKIEHFKANGKLTQLEVKLLDKINATARKFEQIILQSLSTGNAQNMGEIEDLCIILSKLNQDPLLQNKISPKFQRELEDLTEKMRSVAENYKDVALVQTRLESYEQSADLAIESLTAQQKALEEGHFILTIDDDLTILALFDQLIGFYKTYEHQESLPLYHAELISRLTHEAYALRFNREEFCSEFREAVEVEVLKALQDFHRESSADPEANEQYETLLLTLIEAKNKIELAKATLDSHIQSLNQPEEPTTKLFKEFTALHGQLGRDLEFMENQIKLLYEKQTVGFFGRMKISSRGKQIEHNVRIMKEVEEDVPKGWGKKLLSLAMWGLYLTPQISALAQFAGRTYQAVATGESPLKETADLMSKQAFARQVSELPIDEQQTIDLEVNTIHGVLNGYIPLTESMAEKLPEAAAYLEDIKSETSIVPDNQVSNPASTHYIPIPILSRDEANMHALRYMGSQVQEHYEASGKQLAWERPFGNLPDQSWDYSSLAERPQSMFNLFGQECADSIREAKTGVPLEENERFQKLQEHTKAVFGVKLPIDWFSGWLLNQAWSDERLDNFEDWFAHNLECQVMQHISNQDIHVKTEATGATGHVPLSLSGTTSVDASDKSQTVKTEPSLLITDTRQFEVIENLSDEIYPGKEMFAEPLTSSASRPSSPLKVAVDVYRYVKDKVKGLWGASASISDKTLLHQLGDFFGKNTGLEGYNQIEAYKFYRGLISSLLSNGGETEHLQKMGQRIDKAIQLSRLLNGDVNHFQNQLKAELSELITGDSFFLAGGWAGDPAGHALIYEIIKQSENVFSFRIYNTGSGTEHHVSENLHLKRKIVPYVEIQMFPLIGSWDVHFCLPCNYFKRKFQWIRLGAQMIYI
ncbi:MAG TPA: hypothetical protein VGP47_11610 [Parachlamydiaceae bacterium]|nr:hypothetical protein [Parachlamydiaceae bacterium]